MDIHRADLWVFAAFGTAFTGFAVAIVVRGRIERHSFGDAFKKIKPIYDTRKDNPLEFWTAVFGVGIIAAGCLIAALVAYSRMR
jgi:hypothetical protein